VNVNLFILELENKYRQWAYIKSLNIIVWLSVNARRFLSLDVLDVNTEAYGCNTEDRCVLYC